MRWAFRCRRDCRRRCSSRWRIRCWNWCAAMRARTARSRCARRRTRFALDAPAVENALRQLARRGPRAGRRIPSRRPPSRVVRCRSAAPDPAQVAGAAAPRSRAGGAAHAGALPHALAGAGASAAHGPRALDALLDAIENLQGAPLPASLLETAILPARVAATNPAASTR